MRFDWQRLQLSENEENVESHWETVEVSAAYNVQEQNIGNWFWNPALKWWLMSFEVGVGWRKLMDVLLEKMAVIYINGNLDDLNFLLFKDYWRKWFLRANYC